MAASTSDLEAQIRHKLPDFDDYGELLPKLRRLGVTKLEDLKHVDWKDIVPPLTIVQAKRLLEEFSGDVSARDEYKLKQRDQDLRYLELKKSAEADKMKYKADMEKMRVDIHKHIAGRDKEIRAIAAKEVSAEDVQRNVGAGAYGAGVGAAFGAVFGPVGVAVGAGIGAAIGGGLGAVVSSGTVEIRQDQKVQKATELMVEEKKRLEELDKDIERQVTECKLDDLSQLRLEFKKD